MNLREITINFDGAIRDNKIPSVTGQGVLMKYGEEIIASAYQSNLKPDTNNDSEWNAFLLGIDVLLGAFFFEENENINKIITHYDSEPNRMTLKPFKIRFLGDSQLIVNQYNGVWNTSEKFLDYKSIAKTLIEWFEEGTHPKSKAIKNGQLISLFKHIVISVEWIPREQNKEADILSKIGLKQAVLGNETVHTKFGQLIVE